PASVTEPFDRESFNSVEQTFTVVVVSFMVAPADYADYTDKTGYRKNQSPRQVSWRVSHGYFVIF
ncbi:MAG: hypothetical protein RIQ79_2367, partial [Verrucomicrobiota bacterium]